MLQAGFPLVVAIFAARIAIVSSSNQAAGQAPLLFADRDGERMVAVLSELGSFAGGDVWSLPNTTASAVRAALERAERLAEREPGSEILFYFSGHADGEGLLMGGERFSYRELRDRLARSRAQVRVAVLDACQSGSATRPKGGRPGTGPAIPAVSEVQVNGAAILAASGAEEVAQESSEIEGSYFTHHLISGLRGAGDRDGNGQVTLAEAYTYVYARTLAATVPSLWGPQHPAYDYRLSGTGDLILTTLRRSRQGIVFAPGLNETYSVFDLSGEVIGEIQTNVARSVRLALPAGGYRISLHRNGEPSATAGEIALTEGRDLTVDRRMLKTVRPEYALAKGGGEDVIAARASDGLFADYALVGRGLATAGISSEFGLTFRHSGPRWSVAPRLSYGEVRPDDVGVPLHLRRYGAAAYVMRRIAIGSVVDLHVGAGAAATRVIQYQIDRSTQSAVVPGLAAALALEIPVTRWVALRCAWDAGIELVPIDGVTETRFATRAIFGIGVRR